MANLRKKAEIRPKSWKTFFQRKRKNDNALFLAGSTVAKKQVYIVDQDRSITQIITFEECCDKTAFISDNMLSRSFLALPLHFGELWRN